MRRKNLSVLNLRNSIKNNNKILNVYSNFKKNLNLLKNKSFIVSVSGGPDSLALAALSKLLSLEKKISVFFVLVDHGIRINSKKEATEVKKLLKSYKINLNIIKNKVKIIRNIQSQARQIRYDLIVKFAKKKNIKFILTGHHSDDQIETFLIRLSRGSGIQGLSSMRMYTKLHNNCNLIRPFLDLRKIDLIYVAKKIFGKVFNDPSNKDRKYLRTRMRTLKVSLEKNGIHHNQILKSIKNIASSADTFNQYFNKIYLNNVLKKKKEILINNKRLSKETLEIQLKVISKALTVFSNSYYPPRSKKISGLIERMNEKKQKKLTLSGCIIEKSSDFISIKKEVKN